MLKTIVLAAAATVMAGPTVAAFQESPAQPPAAAGEIVPAPAPAPPAAVPVAPVAEPPAAPAADARPVPMPRVENRRQAVRMMEAILSSAVRGGAEALAEQLGSGNPNMSFFTGTARSRGFILDGYGVFFHVEIPEMQSSLVMSVSTVQRDLAVSETLDSLRRITASLPEGALKIQQEKALERLQLQVGPLPQVAEVPPPPGVVRATDTAPSGAALGAEAAPMPVLRDPGAVYREAIKDALIDAMLEHSRGMNIRPDEWLAVAAQRGDSLLAPNEIVTSSTLVLRIKGSDLAVYDADRTRKAEIRRRVEVREF